MMNRIIAHRLAWLAILLPLCLCHAARAQGTFNDRDVVTITLMAETSLDESIIYLDRIAKISGGPIALRQRIGRLDIADMKLGVEQVAIPSDQIRFRLILAGIDETRFRMAGAKRALVTELNEPITARKIAAVAYDAASSDYPGIGSPRDVVAPQWELRPADRVQLQAEALKTPRAGVVRVDVAVIINGKRRDSVPVTFDVPASEAVASKPGDVRSEIRKAGFVTPAKEAAVILIKARDVVKIVVPLGTAQLVAFGEAQQDGRLGEIIPVRNVESNRIIRARVEKAGVVFVDQ